MRRHGDEMRLGRGIGFFREDRAGPEGALARIEQLKQTAGRLLKGARGILLYARRRLAYRRLPLRRGLNAYLDIRQ
jgi:hypothetical protein